MTEGAAAASADGLDAARLRRLLQAGRALVSQLELEGILGLVLDTARELTGARYAALGILDADRVTLEHFVTRGIDEETHRRIGDAPRGRGVLGTLISDPRPLRLADVAKHPLFSGFPPGHPQMRSFLGVPLVIAGKTCGNLYLAEKYDAQPFELADEQTVVILAEWASIAISNARLYTDVERRRGELERVVRRLEATTAIARAIGGETELPRILELIVRRGRALVDSRAMVLLIAEGGDLVVAASAGEVQAAARGKRIPISGSTSGEVLRAQRPERIDDVPRRLRISADHLGVQGSQAALLVPLAYRGRSLGVLVAFDRAETESFRDDDERLMVGLAASAATAVASAQSVERDRLKQTLEAAEQERRRWARELHDETLQGLAGLQVMLTIAQQREEPGALSEAVAQAVEQLTHEIHALRTLISELRPAALDELGLGPAIETLAGRMAMVNGFELELELDLDDAPRAPDIETAAYRIVQECLTNVAHHARADHVRVALRRAQGQLTVEVSDDGMGFRTGDPNDGFGLLGMRERIALIGGSLDISSSSAGTRVTARVRQDG